MSPITEEAQPSEPIHSVSEPQLALFELDTEPVTSLSNVHTAKRGKRERSGVHDWHGYYAGYAEQFVSDTLDVLGHPGDIVLDPWNGSGTTTWVAQYKGYPSLGLELNPIMALHAQAKDLRIPERAEAIQQTARTIIEDAQTLSESDLNVGDSLLEWVHPEPAHALVALRHAIEMRTGLQSTPGFLEDILIAQAKTRTPPSTHRAFFLSALFQVLREVGKFKKGSNPTWLVTDESASSTKRNTVFEHYHRVVKRMVYDLDRGSMRTDKPNPYWVMIGDSRAMDIRDNSIDLIITSPPYCTRIDYVVSTKPELLLMGYEDDEVDGLRRENIGAPVIVDKSITMRPIWGSLCNAFLRGVKTHRSKASKSYYLPIYLQYFQDAERSLRDIKRVLKPEGRGAIVVQSSYYKELELPLGDIYVEMAQALGLHAEIGRREVVRQHMAHINTRSSEYVKEKVYHEDVVYVENPGS
jgi:hypothetical protein